MPEIFNPFQEDMNISPREKPESFFLKARKPIRIIKNIVFSAFIVYIIFNYSKIIETFIPNIFKFITIHAWESAIALFMLLTIKKYLASYAQNFFSSLTNKYFMLSLAVLAIAGASAALFIPSYTNWFRENDSAKSQQTVSSPQPTQSGQDTGNQQKQESKNSVSELRGHLLYITGGVIAVLGLIETNRKNSQDHIRQVHAARRERYIDAVDKLSNKNAPVRLGGVYALVGLVDEWLDDDNIDAKTQIKEGQIIINNLCSYIRSPFPLVENIEEYEAYEELVKLQKKESEKLNEEEFLRLQVLLKRFENPNDYKKPKDVITAYAKFHEEQDVRRTIFVEMSKRSSTSYAKGKKVIKTVPGFWSDFDFDFTRAPIFYPLTGLTIEQGDFGSARFYGKATFWSVKFIGDANFLGAKFTGEASFMGTKFTRNANFLGAKFTGEASFMGTKFTRNADFRAAKFAGDAYFTGAKFTRGASFMGAEFTEGSHFSSTTFTGGANFKNIYFEKNAPIFADDSFGPAYFSAGVDSQSYNFSVRSNSQPIELGSATLGDKTFRIPFGTVVFDPDSWDKKTKEYTHMSVTCCRIHRSPHHRE